MIAMLKGTVALVREEYIVLDVQGVGYKVFTPRVSGIVSGQGLTLHTHLQVREDALTLFGFRQAEELELFELLISVSGMGPKTALSVLTHLEVDQVGRAVLTEDLTALTGIPGVGRKTAQRLVLELKDKFKDYRVSEAVVQAEGVGDEALAALTALGYAPGEAKNALAKALKDNEGAGVETLIKLALKHIR